MDQGDDPVGTAARLLPHRWVRRLPSLDEFFVHHEDVRRANGRGPRTNEHAMDEALWRNVSRRPGSLRGDCAAQVSSLTTPTSTCWKCSVCPLTTQSGADGQSLTGRPQVHARYIAGLPEVNHSMSPRASGRASSPDVRAPGSCDPSRSSAQSQAPGTRPACSHASRGYYGPYLPPGRTTAAHVCSMFARMSRYGPVAAGITRHPLSWFVVQSGRSRHVAAHPDTR